MSAGWVYRATVRHARRERVGHVFHAPALYVQVDVDSAFVSRLFAIDRRRASCVFTRDYLGGGLGPLRTRLSRWLPGLDAPGNEERVYLTTIPRVLGYAFNPLSVFLCVDRDNRPRRALVEVRNTYGEAHLYPLPEIDARGRARAPKELFVSPFFGVDGDYEFAFAPPGANLGISVRLERDGETALEASVFGLGRPLTDRAMALALATHPFSALSVFPRIAWEALVLQYRKGLTPRMRPIARSERTVVGRGSEEARMSDSSGVALPFALENARQRAARLQRLVAWLTIVVPSLGMLAAVATVVMDGAPSRVVLATTTLFYVITVLGVTVGYHRHFTHAAFGAPTLVRAVLAAAGSMAAQGPLIFWVAEHRAHHQFSDREGDPHSPGLDGLWHAHVGWMLDAAPPDLGRYAIDLLRDRLAMGMNQAYFAWVALGIVLPGAIAGLVVGSWAAAASGVLWGGLVRIFLVHHATWAVNSICHRFGSRPHATRDGSTNHWLVALFSLGEGWHNNHHAFPTSARHGRRRFELDPSFWTIRLLAAAGLATLREPRSSHER